MITKVRNLWDKFKSRTYRRTFAESQLSTTVAAQIVAMREDRGWTQKRLGDEAGMGQSRICVLEDPANEAMTIKTLKRIARAFDVVLVVRFVPFSELLRWRTSAAPQELAVPGFDDDVAPTPWVDQHFWSTSLGGRPVRYELSAAEESRSFTVNASPPRQVFHA